MKDTFGNDIEKRDLSFLPLLLPVVGAFILVFALFFGFRDGFGVSGIIATVVGAALIVIGLVNRKRWGQ